MNPSLYYQPLKLSIFFTIVHRFRPVIKQDNVKKVATDRQQPATLCDAANLTQAAIVSSVASSAPSPPSIISSLLYSLPPPPPSLLSLLLLLPASSLSSFHPSSLSFEVSCSALLRPLSGAHFLHRKVSRELFWMLVSLHFAETLAVYCDRLGKRTSVKHLTDLLLRGAQEARVRSLLKST